MASPDEDPTRAYDQMLDEVARLSLSLARELHDAALNAETPTEKANLAGAFHKVTRGLRQTVALHSRLKHDHQAFRREYGPQIARDHAEQVSRRRTEVHNAVARIIWDEHEKPEEADFLIGELFEVLDDEVAKPAFLLEPVELQIQRIRRLFAPDEDDSDEDILDEEIPDEPPAPAAEPAPPPADSS